MSDNKKYYYLKLKENFYNMEDTKLLESMENGYEYSSLYLKLCLLSLKGEGMLLYKNRIPYKPEMLSTVTGHSVEVINYAIPIFIDLEMLTIFDNGTIFIDDIQTLIGHSSTEAERKARYRLKIKDQKEVGQSPGQFPPELKIKKEIKIKTIEKKDNVRLRYDEKKLKGCLELWKEKELPTLDWDTAILNLNEKMVMNIEEYNIPEAIKNYAIVLYDKKYMYTWKWMFWNFLEKGFKKFLPQSTPFEAFRDMSVKDVESEEDQLKRIGEAL